MLNTFGRWLIVKWFWFVRNTAAAARQGWEAAGERSTIKKATGGLVL